MNWKYDLIKKDDGFIVVEKFDDGCYSELDENDWYFDTKKEAIEMLTLVIKDLEDA